MAEHRKTSRVASEDRSLLNEGYYHGLLSRHDADAMLSKQGDFLVRQAEVEHATLALVIACKWDGAARNFQIGLTSGGKFHLGDKSFDSVPLLVAWYMGKEEPLSKELPVVLKRAILHQPWQLSHDRIRLGERLGQGTFGDVFKAVLIDGGSAQTVAIKTFRGNANDVDKRRLFLQEAGIMRNYRHPNIIRLIGVAAQKEPLMLVLEFATGGSLLTTLRTKSDNLGVRQRIRYCLEAACGLRYLEKQKCIHRDVAARNCLLSDRNELKISDFGLSVQEQSVRDGAVGHVPIKWLAPETLRSHEFSGKTDVWAFGVLLWEVFADGIEPYPGFTNADVRTRLRNAALAFRMTPAVWAPPTIRQMMSDCWHEDPKKRPTFKTIERRLSKI